MATKKVQKNTGAKNIDVNAIIKKPRITEKATRVLENNVYTFDVMPNTTKIEVKKAIMALYNVAPMKVNIIVIKKKEIMVRGRKGSLAGGKKALVYLKKGDTIDFA